MRMVRLPPRTPCSIPAILIVDLKRGQLRRVTTLIDLTPTEFPDLACSASDTRSGAEIDDGLLTSFEYNTDLFVPATITRMIGHFQTVLAGIVPPTCRLSMCRC